MSSRRTDPLADALEPLPDAPICIALSGGLDSTALLDVLARRCVGQPQRLRALHVHHGLSVHADAWADACAATCAALAIPLVVRRVRIQSDAGHGPEAAARDARRRAFADVLEPVEVLALAHHRDDQAETLLLRALRGSGPDGLGAMHRWQPFAQGRLWRPWLDVPRALISAHAVGRDLRWVEDDSNVEDRFDRNYLRHHVMPLLRARWPHADAALANTAAHCRDASTLLDEDDRAGLELAATPDRHVLSLTVLRRLPELRRARVLRAWIASLDLPPLPRIGVQHVDADLLHARPDAAAAFEWHGAVLRAWRDQLHAGRARPPLPAHFAVAWDGNGVLHLPEGGCLHLHGADCFDQPVEVRARQGGERITLPGRSHSHALKHVLQAQAVAPWTRDQLPLLHASDGALLAAGDLIRSAALESWLQARGARLEWTPPRD